MAEVDEKFLATADRLSIPRKLPGAASFPRTVREQTQINRTDDFPRGEPDIYYQAPRRVAVGDYNSAENAELPRPGR